MLGKSAAKSIMRYFKTMEKLKDATVDELKNVNDIGEVSALCIRDFFTDEDNCRILERLREEGVKMTAEESETIESPLTGKTVVVTGNAAYAGTQGSGSVYREVRRKGFRLRIEEDRLCFSR